jgi:copper(I)-binding protein
VNADRVTGRRLGAGLAVAAALLTSACAAGQLAQTSNERPTIDATNKQIGDIKLQSVAIQAPTGSTKYKAGADAALTVVIVNTGKVPDTLTSITTSAASDWGVYKSAAIATQVESAESSGTASATVGAHAVTIQPGEVASFGVPTATGGLLLRKIGSKGLYAGNSVQITFAFSHAGTGTATVPVQLADVPGGQTVEPASTGAGE